MINLKDTDSADTIRKNIKYGTTCQAFKGIFLEYFDESSIHGLRYIGEQKRSALDRIMWLVAVIVSIAVCFYLLSNIWDKRINDPVIMTLDGKQTPVWEIPFPTVTICPEIKTHFKDLNFTEDEQYFSEVISQTCLFAKSPNYTTFENHIPNASKFIKVMLDAALTLEETFVECRRKHTIFKCKDLFVPVLTEEGICFSYNSITSEHYRTELNNSRKKEFFIYNLGDNSKLDWDLDHGYTKESLYYLNTIPRHEIGATDMESLKILLVDKNEEESSKCRIPLQRFKLSLRTPGEEPQVSKKFINIPFDQRVSLAIKASIVTTSEDLRHYSPKRRQCYYQNERYLRYFTVYTQANCELECQANQTLENCGCVKFSMPRSSSQPVCGVKNIKCYQNIANNFGSLKFIAKTNIYGYDSSKSTCIDNCLPTCFDIKYKAELEHQVTYDHSDRNKRLTEITMKFEDDSFNGVTRSELYSTTDFIANCGGLLGLFMGISILSVVELVYFFTIRLWWNLQSRRKVQDRAIKNINETV